MKQSINRHFVMFAVLTLLVLASTACAKKQTQETAAATTAAPTTAATEAATTAAATQAPETTPAPETTAAPAAFELSEIHDIVSAEAIGEFGTVKTENFSSLRWIEKKFSAATKLNGWPNCPYDMIIRLTRNDGAVFEVQPATDSCDNMLIGGNDWYCYNNGDGGVILFDIFNLEAQAGTVVKSAGLPEYKYNGNDGVVKALTEYFVKENQSATYEGSATVPTLVLIRKEEDSNGNVKVYGNFWVHVYSKRGTSLFLESGGERPGVAYLTKTGDNTYEVTKFDEVGTGSDYDKDVERICNGDKELRQKYADSANGSSELNKTWKNWFLYSYIKDNNLQLDSYWEYGWDPVPITPAEKMPEY